MEKALQLPINGPSSSTPQCLASVLFNCSHATAIPSPHPGPICIQPHVNTLYCQEPDHLLLFLMYCPGPARVPVDTLLLFFWPFFFFGRSFAGSFAGFYFFAILFANFGRQLGEGVRLLRTLPLLVLTRHPADLAVRLDTEHSYRYLERKQGRGQSKDPIAVSSRRARKPLLMYTTLLPCILLSWQLWMPLCMLPLGATSGATFRVALAGSSTQAHVALQPAASTSRVMARAGVSTGPSVSRASSHVGLSMPAFPRERVLSTNGGA